MKNFVFVILLSANVFAQKLDLRCWDSTYSYDAFHIEERDDGIEVALSGHFFAYREIVVGSAPHFGFELSDMRLFFKFKNSACTSLLNNNIYCKAQGTFQAPFGVFSTRTYMDLDDYVEIITKVAMAEVELTFNGENLSLSLTPTYLDEADKKTTNIQVDARDCDNPQFTPNFSERLRDYLGNVND